jgi:hypothetical protein
LASFHGLPRCSDNSVYTIQDFCWPPSQSLDSIFVPAWNQIGFVSQNRSRGVQINPCASVAPETHSWLPHLGRFLSHEWIDQDLITSTASKKDNAAAPRHLWDNHLELLYPGVIAHLPGIRSKLLCILWSPLLREICEYLCSHFGCIWIDELIACRKQQIEGRKREERKKRLGIQ